MDIGELIHKCAITTRHPSQTELAIVNTCAIAFDGILPTEDFYTWLRTTFIADGVAGTTPHMAHLRATQLQIALTDYMKRFGRG